MRQTEWIAKGRDPRSLMVRDLMEDNVVTCNCRTTAAEIARLMCERNFGSLPVVEEDGALVGLVSEYDLLQLMIEGRDPRKVMVSEIMTPHVVTITEDMALESLGNLFQDRHVTRVPVVRGPRLVGIVARRDLVFGYMKALEYWS